MTLDIGAPDPNRIGGVDQPPYVRLPDPLTLFGRRAARLQTLAQDNPLEGFLRLMAGLVDAQRLALAAMPGSAPDNAHLARCHDARLPPLGRAAWSPGPLWRQALAGILERFDASSAPAETRAARDQLRRLTDDALDTLAERLLAGTASVAEAAAAWFVTAALQVAWTAAAATLDANAMQRLDRPGLCPVCGAAPVASVLRASSGPHLVRYLHCGLCASEWHLVRITCANCHSTKGVAYQGIEDDDGPVKAETCDECHSYTKLVSTERHPEAEPLADDLATLALDVLVDEAGWHRAHGNPFVLIEAAESPGP